MADNKQYITIMIEDLRKKSALLDQIIEANIRLSAIIAQEDMNLEEFGAVVEEKGDYVARIDALDVGFQTLFDRVKEELDGNRETYREEIRTMQTLIKEITDKSVSIQAEEEKSRLIIDGQFSRMKQKVRESKKSVSVANNYYKSMSKTGVIDSQFMDIKN